MYSKSGVFWGRQYTLIFFCAQNKWVSNTMKLILFSLHFLTFCTLLEFSIYYTALCSFSQKFWAHYIPSHNYALLYFCSSSSMAILLTTLFFFCCIRGWNFAENKPNCIPAGTQRSEWLSAARLHFWLWPIWPCKSGFIQWGLAELLIHESCGLLKQQIMQVQNCCC